MMPLSPIWLSLELAAVTTVILLLIGVPLAWWLARSTSRASAAVNAVVTLPLVLPPSVLGFYVLVALGPNGPIGILTEAIGLGTLNFTFTGLVVGSVIYSLPFMVQPLEAAFAGIGQRLSDSSLATKVRSRLVTTENVYLSQMKVVVERGVVYLMGIVTPQENELALKVASRVGGAAKVISYCDIMSAERIAQRMRDIQGQQNQ